MYKMKKISDDVLQYIVEFGNLTELWSLSRTCKSVYKILNKIIYKFFKIKFDKIIDIKLKKCNMNINLITNHLDSYVFSGSLVWSTLIGKTWENQDIDIYTESKNRIYIDNIYDEIKNNNEIYTYTYGYDDGYKFDHLVNIIFNSEKIIDIINYDSLQNMINKFDIIGCSCTFSNKELTIPIAYNTLFSKTYVNKENLTNKTENRIKKYESRGIIFL